ncbi:hypothetical protein [Pseudomonas sp. GD03944]|uniref:hypothetical protein n=1 Tax=Pseudomonas sp. GD03944 TaxID=2975409 RepID=UPI0024485E71|nr:hypothetical protein [Pseudomonas sp. GD03944]MDH1264720.1 hypothetical protein [Pseudomonas sp. GD03944]
MNEDEDTTLTDTPSWDLEFPSRGAYIRFCKKQPLLDVLRSIKHGGPEWAHRCVTLCYAGSANSGILFYPLQDSEAPYFDFRFDANVDPRQVLRPLLERYPQCSILDWSRGRLACLEAVGVNVELLSEIMQEVASLVWGEQSHLVDGWYEEMGRA